MVDLSIAMLVYQRVVTGWWLTYPSEKYEIYYGKNDPNHQPDELIWIAIDEYEYSYHYVLIIQY